MKRMTLFMSAAIALGLSACSSDDTIIDNGTNGNGIPSASLSYAPTRAAEVSAYSNGHRVAKKQQAVVSVSNVAPLDNALLESTAEVFLNILPEDQDNLNITPTKAGVSNWTTNYLYVSDGKPFTLYPAYSKTSSHDIIGIYYYDEEGVKHEQDIFDNEGQCPWWYYKDKDGIQITVEKGYKFGFYLRTTYGYNRNDRDNNFVGNVEETYYSNISENTACSSESHYKFWEDNGCYGNGVHSASFSYGGNTFFGFEDWEHHNTSTFDLNDVVFMITSELSIKDQPKEEDKKPEVTPTPTPEPEPTPTPTPEPGEDPAPSVVAGNGSVEVNFSIYDRKYEANETKLSIHVRDTTDVTIVIPTPADYYCPVDDMAIVQKHDIAQVYNTSSTVDMDINGNKVSLTTTYAKDGITISTNGINAEVLKYLRDTYGDGLTFEINSYFATERVDASGNKVAVTRDEIQKMLNRSTISFTNTPKFYLNAFGVIDNAIIPNDCNVAPADATLFGDREGVEPEHGSTSYLYIWERK